MELDLTLLFTFIKEWGFPLVALILLVRWIKPKADQLWNKAMGITANSGREHHITFLAKNDAKITDVLADLLNAYDCQWATLWQYHNGDYNLSGFPFLRISATHQKFTTGKKGWAVQYQRLPTSLLFPPAAYDCKCHKITPENSDQYGFTNISRAYSIKTSYVCPIYNSSDLHVANVTLSFDKDTDLNEEQCIGLLRFASRLSTLLEVNSIVPRGE